MSSFPFQRYPYLSTIPISIADKNLSLELCGFLLRLFSLSEAITPQSAGVSPDKFNDLIAQAQDAGYIRQIEGSDDSELIDPVIESDRAQRERERDERPQVERYKIDKPEKNKRGYVYLMFDPAFGYCKIGYSADPIKRHKQLSRRYPHVELIDAIPTDDMIALEAAWHEYVAQYRMALEWFDLPDEIVDEFIEKATEAANVTENAR